MWSKWVELITHWVPMGNPNCPGALEKTMDWPEVRDFKALSEKVTCAEEVPLYRKSPENETQYAVFTDGSITGRKMLYRLSHDKLLKMSKEKVN